MDRMDDRRQLSDPRVLRAIAHPVRTRILEEMSASGPVRAADVAQSLGIPANQASFHLRQLAKYGMVEEAPEGPATSATGSGGRPRPRATPSTSRR
jgi:predicted ArsR family transcriptional regulator